MTEQQEQRPGASTEPPDAVYLLGEATRRPLNLDEYDVIRSALRAGAASTEATPVGAPPDHDTPLFDEAGLPNSRRFSRRASTEAAPPHEPVYLYWSEYDDSATVKGWGGDNIYKCRECPEWEGDSDSAPRHSALHRRASTEATPPHSLSCEVVETLGSGHERCQCTCHDGELRASTEVTPPHVYDDGVMSHVESDCKWQPSAIYPGYDKCGVNGAAHYRASTEATERMRQNIAALRRDDDRDRYLRERFRQDVAAISGATEGPGLCPRCGVTLADTGYYEDGQRCHDPAEATERPDLRIALERGLEAIRDASSDPKSRLLAESLLAALTGASPSEPSRPDDVGRLGLSGEQTRNLREHLASRQQTLGEWIGDVLFDFRLGRPDGIEYPPAQTAGAAPEEERES